MATEISPGRGCVYTACGEAPVLCLWVLTVAIATADKTNIGLCVDTGPGQKLPNPATASLTAEGRAGLRCAKADGLFLVLCLFFRVPVLTF